MPAGNKRATPPESTKTGGRNASVLLSTEHNANLEVGIMLYKTKIIYKARLRTSVIT